MSSNNPIIDPLLVTQQLRKPISSRKPKGYWLDVSNRERFFKEFALEHGLDLAQPADWINVTKAQIMTKEVLPRNPNICPESKSFLKTSREAPQL